MAVRDRNLAVWQSYVIAVSIISLLLAGVLLYVLFSKGTNDKMVADAQAQNTQMQKQIQELGNKMNLMQAMLGGKQYSEAEFESLNGQVGQLEDMLPITTQFETDMAMFGPNVAPQDRSYGRLIDSLMQALRDRNLQLEETAKQMASLNQEVVSVRETERGARQEAEANAKKLEGELAALNQKLVDQSNDAQKKLDNLSDQLTSTTRKYEKQIADTNDQLSKLRDENDALVKFKTDTLEFLARDQNEEYEAAQGKVIDVYHNLVAINLGSRDGLRTGLTFNVLSKDTVRISDARPKAKVEIVSVSERQSQARIIDDRLNVPVLPDDLIYSNTWGLGGRKKQYALLGRLDIDGNGSDDRELVKSLIVQNGGEIVEELGPNGQLLRSGEGITIATDYLVIGDLPSLESTDTSGINLGLKQKYADMESRAKYFGVESRSLAKVMGMLRSSSDDRMIPLGVGLGTAAPKFDENRRVSIPTVFDETFRSRRPPNSLGGQ